MAGSVQCLGEQRVLTKYFAKTFTNVIHSTFTAGSEGYQKRFYMSHPTDE